MYQLSFIVSITYSKFHYHEMQGENTENIIFLNKKHAPPVNKYQKQAWIFYKVLMQPILI